MHVGKKNSAQSKNIEPNDLTIFSLVNKMLWCMTM